MWGFVWNLAVAMAGLGSLGHIHRHKGDSVVRGSACHVPKHLVHPEPISLPSCPPGHSCVPLPPAHCSLPRPSFTHTLPALGPSGSGFGGSQTWAGVGLPVCCCVTQVCL